MAHETAVHRVDVADAVGDPTPVPAPLGDPAVLAAFRARLRQETT